MDPKFKRLVAIALNLCLLVLATAVYAQVAPTREWVNFYGTALLNGKPVAVDTIVHASIFNTDNLEKDSKGIPCEEYKVTNNKGLYGYLACYIDDPQTLEVEGIKRETGAKIQFLVRGIPAGDMNIPANVANGDRFQFDLSATSPQQIPEPISVTLFGLGLAGLAGYVYRLKKR